MPIPEDPAAATARLETALDRIAVLARRPAPAAARELSPPADLAEVAARLDTLIARLRSALARPAGWPAIEASDEVEQ